jgi:hypothetical protein
MSCIIGIMIAATTALTISKPCRVASTRGTIKLAVLSTQISLQQVAPRCTSVGPSGYLHSLQ